MIIAPKKFGDRIRLIAIEMEGVLGNEGALPLGNGDAVALSSAENLLASPFA